MSHTNSTRTTTCTCVKNPRFYFYTKFFLVTFFFFFYQNETFYLVLCVWGFQLKSTRILLWIVPLMIRKCWSNHYYYLFECIKSLIFWIPFKMMHRCLRPFSPAMPSIGIWNEYSSYRCGTLYSFKFALLSLNDFIDHNAKFLVFPWRTNTWNWNIFWTKIQLKQSKFVFVKCIRLTWFLSSTRHPIITAQCALWPFFRHGAWLKSES